MVCVASGRVWHFADRIPREWRRRLLARETQINLFELIAFRIALATFGSWFAHSRVVAFVDNSAALSMVVRGWSKADDANEVAGECWHDIAACGADVHFEWVPSKLNLADGPSRGDFDLLRQLRSREVSAHVTM